jgi:hypothetical protein
MSAGRDKLRSLVLSFADGAAVKEGKSRVGAHVQRQGPIARKSEKGRRTRCRDTTPRGVCRKGDGDGSLVACMNFCLRDICRQQRGHVTKMWVAAR